MNTREVLNKINKIREEEWNKVKEAKFQNVDPVELEQYKTLWFHGFIVGGETIVKHLEVLADLNSNQISYGKRT